MFESLLVKVASALKKGGIPYMVIGGQAVLQYGEPRLTRDIDITLGVDVHELARVLQVLGGTGLRPVGSDPEEFVQKTNVLPLQDGESGIRVDLIFSFLPYERGAIKRSKVFRIGGYDVQYAAVEDVIIHKIIAGRPRDLEDVKGIIVRNTTCDVDYITRSLHAFEQTLAQPLVQVFKSIHAGLLSP